MDNNNNNENKKSLEEIGYDFQKSIMDTFNNNELPFLLKYYLLKDIWASIENYKMRLDQEVQTKNKEDLNKND